MNSQSVQENMLRALSSKLSGAAGFARYKGKPVEFCAEVLGITLWSKQADIADSLVENPRTVVYSGHGIGKSLVSAALACYWVCVHEYEEASVVTLAPIYSQVNNIIWRYIRKLAADANLPGNVLETPRWNIDKNRFAVGLSPRKRTEEDTATLQGYHSPYLLVIMDEAAGIPRPIWLAIRNLAVGKNDRILAIMNPIEQTGPAWEAWNSDSWHSINVSCLEHPNVINSTANEPVEIVPGAVSWSWVDSMVEDHCMIVEDDELGEYSPADIIEWCGVSLLPDPIFQSRVLGVAPSESESQLIKLSWIEASKSVSYEPEPEEQTVIALDPSRYGGDLAVMIARKGRTVLHIKRKRPVTKNPSKELGDWLIADVQLLEPSAVYIDEVGIGAGVVDYCSTQNISVMGINGTRKALSRKRFSNMRTENWWNLREAIRKVDVAIPNDPLLEQDLVAVKLTKPDAQGRFVLEPKDILKMKLGRSPDTGDALAMTYSHYQGGLLQGKREAAARIQKELGGGKRNRGQAGRPSKWLISGGSRRQSRWRR